MKFIIYLMALFAAPALAVEVAGVSLQDVEKSAGISRADEKDFRAAYDAFRSGDENNFERYAERLKSSPLDVYVSYYRLKMNLEQVDTSAVKDFLSRPKDTPMIDLLRVDWLKLLGKRNQWELFDLEYPHVLNGDTELTCYALQSRRRGDERGALREARKLWFSGKAQPQSCAELFEGAMTAGIISDRDVYQRLRLILEANNVAFAQQLIEIIPGYRESMSAALKSAAANPDRYLAKLNQESMTEGRGIIALFALQRLAQQSLDLAADRWAKIHTYFSRTEQHYLYGRLAYQAARNLDERALQWYKAAADTPLDENQSAWRVRAALRVQDWREVLKSVNAMNEPQQHEATWQYWKARALQAEGKVVAAREIFVPLSRDIYFYGQLAAEELGDSQVLSEATSVYKPDKQAVSEMLSFPGVQRTVSLYRMGMRSEALEEWRWVVRGLNDRELLAAAEVARRHEMYDRAIGAADMTLAQHDFSMRYLAPYRAELQEHIHEHGLEEAWVYGLMRQESRFATSARSEVGAAGLMQIMPSTAHWVAKKLGLKSYRKALIHQLDTNLRIGTYYMKTVLSQSENSPVLASASYNAGPLRALQWRGNQPLEGAIYAETIPFPETRDYVKKVMSNTVYYANQFGDSTRSLKKRLGVVPARASDSMRRASRVR